MTKMVHGSHVRVRYLVIALKFLLRATIQ